VLVLAALAAALPLGPAEAHRGTAVGPSAGGAPAAADAPVPDLEVAGVAAAGAPDLPATAGGMPPVQRPAGSHAVVPWWLLLTSLLALGAACPLGRRRSIAVGVVLLFAVLAAETGVHSAHLGGDASGAAACQLAAAAQHLAGLDGEVPSLTPVAPVVAESVAIPMVAPASTRALAPHSGRAPPSPSA
jgi:hypothetical protein